MKHIKKRSESWPNAEAYRKNKEPLRHAVMQHPDEDPKTSIFDFVNSKINRKFWTIPYSQLKKK